MLKMGHFAHCYADFFGIPYLKQAQKSAAKWVPGKVSLMAAAAVSQQPKPDQTGEAHKEAI